MSPLTCWTIHVILILEMDSLLGCKLMELTRVLAFMLGACLSLWTIGSALRSFVLPRADRSLLTTLTFMSVYKLMTKIFKSRTPYVRRDAILAMHAPIGLFMLPLVWLSLIIVGYTLMYWALDPSLDWRSALILSGSSLMTLGFAYQDTLPLVLLAFSQAALSMMLIALLIGYLPTMYSAFAERENKVIKMAGYAGSPPNIVELIRLYYYTGQLDDVDFMRDTWLDWQDWFVRLEEIHTTLAPMNFFRSTHPNRHWVTTAGAVLDMAAIIASSVHIERALAAGAVLRSGFLSLRSIADYFDVPYDPDPNHDDPISINREEFEAVLDQLAAHGVPLREDRDYCWSHYAGWRVNYDEVLLGLARITAAPYAMWSSDRAIKWRPEDIPDNAPSIVDGVRGSDPKPRQQLEVGEPLQTG